MTHDIVQNADPGKPIQRDHDPPFACIRNFLRLFGYPGTGLSHSSSINVLYVSHLMGGVKYRSDHDLRRVIDATMNLEESPTGIRLAGQDVTTVVIGGPVLTRTSADGTTDFERVTPCDPFWLSRHALIALLPHGQRHDVPEFLPRLIPRLSSWIPRINELALQAAEAYQNGNVHKLGSAVREYCRIFQLISDGLYVNSDVHHLEEFLRESLGDALVVVKPPGAGAASCAFVLLADVQARDRALERCRTSGWIATPVVPSVGLLCQETATVRTYSAPLRLDFIGLADLSINKDVAADGICFGIAIEPRNELLVFPSTIDK